MGKGWEEGKEVLLLHTLSFFFLLGSEIPTKT
jgi:hypothetical protein